MRGCSALAVVVATKGDVCMFGLRRSRVALLAVAAMVASVLAVGVSSGPVSGDAGAADVDSPAGFSACVGGALESAGFEDIVGTGYESAVDCLAHYGVTVGTGEGGFNPREGVLRWQMALFMTRAAGPAGVSLGSAAGRGFTDIGDLSDEAREAVNRFVGSGIGFGTGDGVFSPNSVVSRVEMAQFLHNFLSLARAGRDGVAGRAVGAVVPDDDHFTDLGAVSVAAVTAIGRLYELGVTAGTSASTFSPSEGVTRGQMARFITRALGHTIARPKGVSVQASVGSVERGSAVQPDLLVSVRDDSFGPMSRARLDLMVAESAHVERLFNADGSCDRAQFVNNTEACVVHVGSFTDANGEFVFEDVVVTDDVNDFTVWVWTGDLGDSFDREDHADVTASTTLSVVEDVDAYGLSTNLPDGVSLAKFGTEVAVVVQLLDVDDIPAGASSNPLPVAGKKFSFQKVSLNPDGSATRTIDEQVTDEDGRIVFTFTREDPDSSADNDDAVVTVVVTDSSGVAAATGESIEVTWSDEPSTPTKLTQELSARHLLIPVAASDEAATYSVSATLTDQYGLGMPGQLITFTSTPDDSGGLAAGGIDDPGEAGSTELAERQRYTGSNGVAVYTHIITHNGRTTAGVEPSFQPGYRVTGGGLSAGSDPADTGGHAAPYTSQIYFGQNCSPMDTTGTDSFSCNGPSEGSSLAGERLRVIDTENNEILFHKNSFQLIFKYDDNDFFLHNDGTTTSAITLDKFEELASAADAIDPITDDMDMHIINGVVTISGYDGTPAGITSITFQRDPRAG